MRRSFPSRPTGTPTYSTQTKALPPVWVQNSSLEIAWTRVLRGGEAGDRGRPDRAVLHRGRRGLLDRLPRRSRAGGHSRRTGRCGSAVHSAAGARVANRPPVARAPWARRERNGPGRLAESRRAGLVRSTSRSLLITQVQRSGGTLLLRLLDGHPHAMSSRSSSAGSTRLRSGVDRPEQAWERAPRPEARRRASTHGHRSGSTSPPPTRRSFPSSSRQTCSAPSTTNAPGGSTTRGRALYRLLPDVLLQRLARLPQPPLARSAGSSASSRASPGAWRGARLRRLYPDGRVVSIVRDPWSWYASARAGSRAGATASSSRRTGAGRRRARKWRKQVGTDLRLISFEDCCCAPEETLRRSPTGSRSISPRACSSRPSTGCRSGEHELRGRLDRDLDAPARARARRLEPDDVKYIKGRARRMYRQLLKEIDRDWNASEPASNAQRTSPPVHDQLRRREQRRVGSSADAAPVRTGARVRTPTRARRRSRRAGSRLRRRLPAERALHDRAGRLRPPRHDASARSTSSPGCTSRCSATGDRYFSSKGHDAPGLYAVLAALGKLDFELIHQLRRLDGLPGPPGRGGDSRGGDEHRLARDGHLEGARLRARRPAARPLGPRVRPHRRRRAPGGPVLGVAAADGEPGPRTRSP